MNEKNGKVIELGKNMKLNRYFSNVPLPRPEGYHIDVEAASKYVSTEKQAEVCTDVFFLFL